MEVHPLLNIRKYKNNRFSNEKYNLRQEDQLKINEAQINNNFNIIQYKIDSSGSRTCKNCAVNENINRPYFSQSNNHIIYNPNNLDRNNYKKDEYFNGTYKYYTQSTKNNQKINEQEYIDTSFLKNNDSKKFTNLSRALRYFNNKITLNNIFYDIYYEPSLGKRLNINNEFSSDKINLDHKNYRNYNELSNYNSRRLTTTSMIKRGNPKTNSIWSNINKDLLLQKKDLNDTFFIEKIKSKTPFKAKNRYFKNNLKLNIIESNLTKKNNEGEDKKYKMNVFDEENKDYISISIKMKDNKELNKKENTDRHFLRKNINSSYNKSLKKTFGQENIKKKYLNKNKILINKKPNQIKNYASANNTLKKNKSTKSSPNILNDFQLLKIRNLNLKSPIAYKDVSIFKSTLTNTGKIPKKNNQSLEYSLDKYSSNNIINNNNLNIKNSEINKNNNKKKSIPKISINLDENNTEKDEQNININQEIKQNNNINENKKEFKKNMSVNNIKYNSINAINNKNSKIYYIESNINNININKKFTNPIYIKQNNNNNIIFRKKINKSPEITKKLNIYKSQNSNLDIKDNNDSIIKLTQEINCSSLKINTNEILNKKNEIINQNQNSYESSRKIYIKQKAIKIIQQPKNITKDKLNKKRIINNEKLDENNIEITMNNDENNKHSLRYKVNNNQMQLIKKYYNYFIKYPKIKICNFSKIYLKNIKIPRTNACYISKANLEIYCTYKNKSICYYTKIRRNKKLLQPHININCYLTKNIILNPPAKIDKNGKKINNNYVDNYLNKKNEIDKMNNRKIIINDKSLINKSLNEDKNSLSEKEYLDIGKNSSIKKKLSPTAYNDDEFNEEENDDFRIVSDEDEINSNDKYKKKDIEKYNKTEGKEIFGGYDKFKMTNLEKTTKVIKLLEKLQGKRKNENEEINNIYYNDNNYNYGNYNDNEVYCNDIYSKSKSIKKNIYLGADKLNEIFSNNQRNDKYNYDNEIEIDENNDLNYSNYNMENNIINERNEIDINKKKNNTYKKEMDYEKISSIFDKLEEIFVKKKSNNKLKVYDSNNDITGNCKTPILKKGGSYMNTKNNNLNLKEEYNYNNNYFP